MPVIEVGPSIKEYIQSVVKAIEYSAQDIADFILFESQKNLVEGDFSPAVGKGAFNRGQLSRSGHVSREDKFIQVVEYNLKYAKDIEYGRDPGPVEDRDLIEWVWDKKAVFRITKKYDAEKVGKMIAKNIRKHGTLPRPFFRRAIASLTPDKINKIIQSNIRSMVKS